ncbi:hypothetical protein [Nostoc sp. TCL240-02]|uniref:hypothetical protein n=1 Tax=Nostoc sp. TCL240-02 TaxID=2572090 RepID=UPI00157FA414|nr:hypothetical protein [Nostoc sp. TCL240-02]QKQ74005.1 hypothetical protein FBB35_12295 [Nostoc sp. TCL240-02]
MIVYPTIYTLFVTRIFQGIAVGLITGTGTAYLSVLMPRSSAMVATYVSLTTSLGFFADRIGILNALLGFGAILFVSNILLAGMYQRANKKSA